MFAYTMVVKRICFSQTFSLVQKFGIQPIVSSKQPFIFTLSALVKFVLIQSASICFFFFKPSDVYGQQCLNYIFEYKISL